ncbi:MAG TPA: hypothetical protein VJB61_13530 [Actinomycetota bacterium]
MGRRWFGDPADEAVLGATLARLVEDVSRLLDRLEAGPVAPGAARVDPEAAAVVLPLRRVPGASLVVQVAEWSSSVGCWWSTAGDPTTAPAAEELFAELPLHPDGPGRAVAWLERELRRPVTDREHGYGVVRRRVWSVVLDDGRELAVRGRWLPGWTAPGSELPVAAGAERGPVPGSEVSVATGAAWGPVPGAGLLVGAVGAAAASWVLAAATPTLFWVSWAWGAVGVLSLAAFALLLAWFRVAGSGRPARDRVPMLAGLGLATLGQAVQLLTRSTRAPSLDDPTGQAFALALRGSLPSLLATAAVACWLAAILGLPGRSRIPAWLPVAAGVGWTLDIVVGLGWLLAAARDHPSEALAWSGAPTVALREAALALAVLLLLAVIDRRPATARAGPAGAVLLVVANSFAVQAGVSTLVGRLPLLLGFALAGTVTLAAWFGGAALLAVATRQPELEREVARAPLG